MPKVVEKWAERQLKTGIGRATIGTQKRTRQGGRKMQVFFFVLNRTELLEHLLEEFAAHGMTGATVLDSKGMARILLGSEEDVPVF